MGEKFSPFSVTATTRSEVIRIPGDHLFKVLGRYPQARAGARRRRAQSAERVARENTFMPAPAGGAKGIRARSSRCPRRSSSSRASPRPARSSSSTRPSASTATTASTPAGAATGTAGSRSGAPARQLALPLGLPSLRGPGLSALQRQRHRPRARAARSRIVEDNCIGCGACAERCPYGNIRMHAVEQPESGFLSGSWGVLGFRARRGGAGPAEAKRLAVKCDLCAGYDYYACVTPVRSARCSVSTR